MTLPTHRTIGNSSLSVSPIGFGCWPITGISSLNVTPQDSLRTLEQAFDSGINFYDTAYSYGYAGEADHLLSQAFANRWNQIVLASKVGSHYDHRTRVVDGRPKVLLAQAEEIIQRLRIDAIDLMYLHQPDPNVPIEDSAGAISQMVARGWVRYAGVSNVDLIQLKQFESECPVIAVQIPFNMLQQENWIELRDYCVQNKISGVCYWALMKGLLAGKMQRDHQFAPDDRRLSYPIYQGQAWQRSQDLLDRLRNLSQEIGSTVAQLVVAWTLSQPGMDIALLGAKRPDQIQETARSMWCPINASILSQIDKWIAETAN